MVKSRVASDIGLIATGRRGQQSVNKLLIVGLIPLHLLFSTLCFLLAAQISSHLALDALKCRWGAGSVLVDGPLLNVADSISQQSSLIIIVAVVLLQGVCLEVVVDLCLVGLAMLVVDKFTTLVWLIHSLSKDFNYRLKLNKI